MKIATSPDQTIQKGTRSKFGGGNTRKTAGQLVPRTADEQDWKRRLNPTNVFDQLPQPFRFVNKCLQNLIITPVFEKIIEIESKKKRADYEGSLREIYPSGTLDLEGVTCIAGDPYHPHSMISSSFAPKLPNGRPHTPTTSQHAHSNKIAIGDKLGQVILVDIGRKIVLSRTQVFEGSRIESMALHSQRWGDMLVTTLIACPRNTHSLKLFYYKSTDYKLIEAFELELPVVDGAKGYEGMIRGIQISKLGDFVAITRYNGEVFVLRLPQLPDPVILPNAMEPPNTQGSDVLGVPGNTAGSNTATVVENFIETDLAAKYPESKKIAIEEWLALRIPGKELARKFDDPFVVDEDAVAEEKKRKEKEEKEAAAAAAAKGAKGAPKGTPAVPEPDDDTPPDHFTLGQENKDSQGGDAGALQFPSSTYSIPEMYFTHALVVGKLHASDSSQNLSKRLITSSLYVVYQGLPVIEVYILQAASMSAVLPDYSYDACASRINAFRKANEKTPNKDTGTPLLNFVKQLAAKNAAAADKTPPPAALDPARAPTRSFILPYFVTATSFVMLNESHQWLGVGLNDGSIVIIDTVLAVQKYFLPKHAKAVTSLAFYSNVSLLSGAQDGIVHIYDMRGSGDDEGIDTPNKVGTVVYKGNNTMDKRFPIVKCCVSEAGLGVVTDITGNARVYDLIRFSKVCKLAPFQRHGGPPEEVDPLALHDTWRFLPRICFHLQRDIMTAVAQRPAAVFAEEGTVEPISEAGLLQPNSQEEAKTPSGIEYTKFNTVQEILEKQYTPGKPFYLAESMLFIFKLEDIMQQLYPQIMSLMKLQKNFKECFWRYDPRAEPSKISIAPKTGNLQTTISTEKPSFNVSGRVSKVGGGIGTGKRSGQDYQVRIAGSGVSPEPEKPSPGLSRFSPKFQEMPPEMKVKTAVTEKSLSSEFMTNRETFAEQSTTGTVKSGSLIGSSPKFQQPTLAMLNPELFSKSVKERNIMKNVEFESIRNVKERHSYHEHRQMRVQKRQEEIARELEQQKQEEIARQRREQLKAGLS